ncbi:MAG TPA: PepSY-associated TM helix domain-containing protein [Burkholderiales bacterium]|jgi:uncharacterized iron-regulated membrane protein|nr:PepSY-associated TM helix domain-containing protein [Burkholderiales bacterium]
MNIDLRNAWVQIHLWLGLTLGVLGIFIGLTGSVLIYDSEIDALLNSQRYAVSGNQVTLAPAEYLAKAAEAMTGRARPANLRLPDEPGMPVTVIGRSGGGAAGERPTIVRVYLDPATGKVLDAGDSGFVAWAHDLHENLLLRQYNGRNIVGAVGIAMLISSLSGIYLWWPGRGRLRSGLTTRRGFPTSRNIHYLVGFYGSLMLGMLSFTGIYLAYPDFGRDSTARLATLSPPARDIKAPEPAPRADAKPAEGAPDAAKAGGKAGAQSDGSADAMRMDKGGGSDGRTGAVTTDKGGDAKGDEPKSEGRRGGGRRSREARGGDSPRIPVDDAVKIAQAIYPDARLLNVSLPTGPRGVYRVGFNMPETALNPPGGSMAVFLDPANGNVLRRVDPAGGTGGDKYLAMMRPLHSAAGLGGVWKVLYFLGGLLPAFLAVTGTLMWLRGRRLRPGSAAVAA